MKNFEFFNAVKNGDVVQVQELITEGVSANSVVSFPDGFTALHWAVRYNNAEMVELLVSAGADIEARELTERQRTPLEYAVGYRSFKAALKLLELGAKASSEVLVKMCREDSLLPIAIAMGADVNAKDDGRTVFNEYIYNGDLASIKLLIEAGADVNEKDDDGFTALHWAVKRGKRDIAQKIISEGADVNAKDNNGFTALHWAVCKRLDLVDLLISAGADVNAKDNNRKTALYIAIREKNTEIIKRLVEAEKGEKKMEYINTTVTLQDPKGNTCSRNYRQCLGGAFDGSDGYGIDCVGNYSDCPYRI